MVLSQEPLPKYRGVDYIYSFCSDCGTGYVFTETDVVFVMPAAGISAQGLWKLEQQYKRKISKPGGSRSPGRKKAIKPLTTERYRLE